MDVVRNISKDSNTDRDTDIINLKLQLIDNFNEIRQNSGWKAENLYDVKSNDILKRLQGYIEDGIKTQ